MDDSNNSEGTVGTGQVLRSPRRLLLAAAGVVCVGLGVLGAVTPGLPTTVFLILASYLFARSCPVLERKLLHIRLFRPYSRFLDGECPIPKGARVGALLWLWGGVTASLIVLAIREQLAPWVASTIIVAAFFGSATVVAFRNPRVLRALRRE